MIKPEDTPVTIKIRNTEFKSPFLDYNKAGQFFEFQTFYQDLA